MKMKFIIFVEFFFILGCINSNGQKNNGDENKDHKSVAELMLEQANAEAKIRQGSIKKLDDYSEPEIEDMLSNPRIENHDIISEYVARLDTEAFFFPPLKKGEEIGYKKENRIFFENTTNSIIANEISVFKVLMNGDEEIIKRFYRAGSVLAEPDDTPGYLFFYIKDQNNEYDSFLWQINGNTGEGTIVSHDWGYKSVSKDGEKLISSKTKKHLFGEEYFKFPIICFYSVNNEELVREFDFYDALKEEIDISDLEEGLHYLIYRDSTYLIAKLQVMNSVLAVFRIDTDNYNVDRIE